MYGISANALLGADMGSAVGWPVLIVVTNTVGLVVGWKVLGEWEVAKKGAIDMVKVTVVSSLVSLIVIGIGGYVA